MKIVERMRNDLLYHPLFSDLVRDPASPMFDEDPSKPSAEKLHVRDVAFKGRTIHVVGL